jgi:hypothetical protein
MEVNPWHEEARRKAAGDNARSPYRRNIVPAATKIIAVVNLL